MKEQDFYGHDLKQVRDAHPEAAAIIDSLVGMTRPPYYAAVRTTQSMIEQFCDGDTCPIESQILDPDLSNDPTGWHAMDKRRLAKFHEEIIEKAKSLGANDATLEALAGIEPCYAKALPGELNIAVGVDPRNRVEAYSADGKVDIAGRDLTPGDRPLN